ncbi:MAG: metallophosphoesterase [Gammaproteobacteria bacterium]|nr:metallophosphoesterase [Gammaproteobacteria bacterium]
MNDQTPEVRPKLLKQLRRAFSGLGRCKLLKIRDAYRLVDDNIRVPFEGFPMELMLGENGKRLHLYPEYPLLGEPEREGPPSFLIEDPQHHGEGIGGFLRLEPGQELTLGRHDPAQVALFHYPNKVMPRHLRVRHDGDTVVFKDRTSDGTCISPMLNKEKTHRLANLRELKDIFSGPLDPLPPDEALTLIEDVIALMKHEAYRPLDSRGVPGGLLELPARLTPVIVADLHAQIDNLLVILSHNGFLRGMEKGEACMIVIGDAVHSERDGLLDNMDDSMLMMDLIFRLKLRFPENFFFLRGNHDSFSEEVAKLGVPQGQLWKRALRKERGKEYRKAMQRYYDLLPYVVVSDDFVAAHASPTRTKISREMLIDIHRYPGLIPEIINNRLQRPSRPGGYTKGDVRRFRKRLDLTADVPFVVGHTPMDQVNTHWLNVGEAENHHILYSANNDWVGVFVQIEDTMWPLRYPVEPLRELFTN